MTVETSSATKHDAVERVTRLAPSPTGALHLGNARTFLVNWALARQRGWRIVMRIEDLDGPRIKPGAAEQTLDILRWLGIDWDGQPTLQSHDLQPHAAALRQLRDAGLIYPCRCTRKEIEQAQSAPHEEGAELRYPGTCRPTRRDGDAATTGEAGVAGVAWRLRVPEGPISFSDHVAGPQCCDVERDLGDFVVATRGGLPAYQFAVVIDDIRQGVTDIVRGDDLLPSTARQLWLYRLLPPATSAAAPPPSTEGPGESVPPAARTLPTYYHLPLIVGPDGRRLAKRHGDTRLDAYRERGVPPERVVGLLAYWSGVTPDREPMAAARFAEAFALDRLPREPIVLGEADDAWLCGR
ncbi:MAG: glutamate--tRNA ligase family protein [Phycisphaeraceae bacterium]